MIFGRGNELSHVGIENVAEGLRFVPQLTALDLRSFVDVSRHGSLYDGI